MSSKTEKRAGCAPKCSFCMKEIGEDDLAAVLRHDATQKIEGVFCSDRCFGLWMHNPPSPFREKLHAALKKHFEDEEFDINLELQFSIDGLVERFKSANNTRCPFCLEKIETENLSVKILDKLCHVYCANNYLAAAIERASAKRDQPLDKGDC